MSRGVMIYSPTIAGMTFLIYCCLISFPTFAFQYQVLEPGLEYAVTEPVAGDSTKLHLFRVDLKKYKVRPVEAKEVKASALSAKEAAKKTDALVLINANFFDTAGKPLGLIIREGEPTNPPHPVSWYAALLIKGDRARIAKVSSKKPAGGVDQAIQAGPRLVVGGSPPKLKAERSQKSAVGIDGSGRLFRIVSEGGVEINELAQYLARPEKQGGLGLSQALNLDGGSSTQFFAKIGDFQLDLPGFSKVPVFLGVFRK